MPDAPAEPPETTPVVSAEDAMELDRLRAAVLADWLPRDA